MQIIRPSEWITQPWRNGGGTTHEVLREGPPDAFTLRVSVADVERAGPFSRFEGIERWIVLLEGAGFALHRGEHSRIIDAPFVAFRFSGEDTIDCTLVKGPVRDLNVMYAHREMTVALTSVAVIERYAPEPPAGATRVLVFTLDGTADVEGTKLEKHELLVADAAKREIVGPADVVVAWIIPK